MNPWIIDYQANNRPVEFVQGNKCVVCIYGHMGRRIEKAAWNNNTLTKRQRYVYNGYVQIAEIDATNENAPQVVKTYLWDPSEPVATRILHMNLWNNGEEMESLYCTHDLQKNVTALFGQAAGRRAQYEYDPYGNLINISGDAAGLNPFRYSSEHHDEDLGLIYYNYRHYNPTDGRWINREPLGERGGINLYGFIGNRVTWHMDRLGLRYILCIYSNCCSSTSKSLTDGHVAIVLYNSINNIETTMGLWPDSHSAIIASGLANGSLSDVRLNFPKDNPRQYPYIHCKEITSEQAKKFLMLTTEPGISWTALHNCATFGCEMFNSITGSKLNSNEKLIIDTPRKVGDAIIQANQGKNDNAWDVIIGTPNPKPQNPVPYNPNDKSTS